MASWRYIFCAVEYLYKKLGALHVPFLASKAHFINHFPFVSTIRQQRYVSCNTS
ncbi:unnamed protein product [Sphenostylis stenocarpa]|uniref:Uncharacterized protein n=1 Tax=Sphenostylis stenocarpa TaxID=92480 RepID=A0AA86SIH8_9FABA|nr:unnamed protein product [Sphenostylis stenocarpa]